MRSKIIEAVRKERPLIHHITNQVVMNFSANGLLAFGGSPIMAKESNEVEEIVDISSGLLLNIGTALEYDIDVMIKAGQKANLRGIPVVIDPVGVGASTYRSERVKLLLQKVKPTVIKGNAGELAHLAGIKWGTKGVDSTGSGNIVEVAQNVMQQYQCAVVLTGEKDAIQTTNGTVINESGHKILEQITGAGCLLGSIMTACIAIEGNLEEQLDAAVYFYGLAAEYAYQKPEVNGPGTFLPNFIDALSYDLTVLERGITDEKGATKEILHHGQSEL
ncbi:hydroxyethylthiazole kinase [Piscibacillus halophilus]|uniref:Hydroxyethylthiazole kinase n=1 Tax=Piscibacillus halophilus TaxID=571933 RepID=A0A1H9GJH5_9BACI|nr:hydroxyethylthiazole kinase [Piscibacillus halophilus]SEQ50193.1 hydroxyethylthiazole kinase [Piscibacillus halophilus]